MYRSMLAIAAGYFTIALLSGFSRLIISVYLKTGISITGINAFPFQWAIGLTVLGFFFGLFAGLLTTTIATSNGNIEILGFILIMVIMALIDYTIMGSQEPMWYLIASPVLKIFGVYSGYHIKKKQDLQLEQTQ